MATRTEPKTKTQIDMALAAIKRAKCVLVWCPITKDEGTYFQVAKNEAEWRIRGFAAYLNDGTIRIREMDGDVYIGG